MDAAGLSAYGPLAYLVPGIVLFAVAFLLGSIPWGVVVSRLFYHTDIRQHGSGKAQPRVGPGLNMLHASSPYRAK